MEKPRYLKNLHKRHKARYKAQKREGREIILPNFSPEFAEFMGALAGDGHITGSSNVYRVEFTLNGTEDRSYAYFLADLFRELFHLEPRVYFRDCSNRVDIQVNSKKIHSFINSFFPSGRKESMNVPEWVKESEKMISAYLRGLIDTDGFLFFAKRGMYDKNCYPVIELKMEDESFLNQIEEMLNSIDIDYYRSSYNKIQLNGENKLEKWMSKVGFSNPNRGSRFHVWRVKNYCPPSTTLKERLDILGISPG